MNPEYQAVIAGAFVDFLDKGYVYKGLKPVNWCIHDRTALAEAEVEYENHKSPSVWVRFALTSDPAAIDPALAGKNVFGLIWTTTPWTLPANLAIAFHPKFEYVAVEVGDGDVYIVAADLLEATAAKCGWTDIRSYRAVPRRQTGRHDLPASVHRPRFRSAFWPTTSRWSREPAQSTRRRAMARKTMLSASSTDLPVYCPVDAAGRFFDAEAPRGGCPRNCSARRFGKRNPIVIEILKERGALLGLENIDHSYPHCWRCHNATIFRATEQWFIGMDNNSLRAERARRHQRRQLDARVGRRAHLQHGRQPPRLVHLAPARLGRADCCFLLRAVPRAADGSQDSR